MAVIKTKTTIIERNSFDYIKAFAESQSSNQTIVDELVQAYVLVAQNLNITPLQFIQLVESKGNSMEQAQFLCQQLNSVRVRSAYLGVRLNQNTPVFIAREIAA